MKFSSSFGGGMGRLREVCGAVTGIFMIMGIKYGYSNPQDDNLKTEHYILIQSIAERFKEANGSIICRELLGLSEGPDNPIPEARTEKYYKTRPCEQLVGFAAELIDELIINKTLEVKKLKMKIAVACEGKSVTEHFGHCENFNIFYIENNKITKSEAIPNPGHRPGFLPNFLNDMGVNVIISGGMGGGAVEIFNEKGIEVITGAQGNSEAAVNSYLEGKLKSTGSICHEHQHHDDCEK
jgi:C_GCAxxG_C_C family probable redox protein